MRYLRRYAAVAIFCVALTVIASGMIAADESARRISLGEPQRVVVFGENARVNEPAEVTDIKPAVTAIIEYIEETKNRILQLLQNAVDV